MLRLRKTVVGSADCEFDRSPVEGIRRKAMAEVYRSRGEKRSHRNVRVGGKKRIRGREEIVRKEPCDRRRPLRLLVRRPTRRFRTQI